MSDRAALVRRRSRETQIECEVRLDHGSQIEVETGLPFLDHMLEQVARYGGFDLKFKGSGDVQVDPHHLMEDAGIVIGQALSRALDDRTGIRRFASAYAPLDESLARVVVDLGKRPVLQPSAQGADWDAGVRDTRGVVARLLRPRGRHPPRRPDSRAQPPPHRGIGGQGLGPGVAGRHVAGRRPRCALLQGAVGVIAIVDYGVGNLRSVARALERSGASPRLVSDQAELGRANGMVLPGVGAFGRPWTSCRPAGWAAGSWSWPGRECRCWESAWAIS